VRNVWKITVDPSTMRLVGLERLTTGPGPDADLAISTDGKRLAYAARSERVRVWSYPFDPSAGRLTGDGEAVTPSGFDAWQVDVSPDRRKLAYVVNRAGEHELWQTNLPDGPATLLLRAGHQPSAPLVARLPARGVQPRCGRYRSLPRHIAPRGRERRTGDFVIVRGRFGGLVAGWSINCR
jgi:WD40-like Beta Propeller Repeat